jgi:hypothetical protein
MSVDCKGPSSPNPSSALPKTLSEVVMVPAFVSSDFQLDRSSPATLKGVGGLVLLLPYVKPIAHPTQEVVLVPATTSLDIQHSGFSLERINGTASPFVLLPNAQNTPEAILVPTSTCDEVRHYGSLSVRSVDAGGSKE